MIDDILRNLRALWRAETIIADIHFRHYLGRSGLRAFAGLIAVFGLMMLNVTGFFAFEPVWGATWAAAAVSACDFVLAAVLVGIAAVLKPGRELDLAMEVRQTALTALETNGRTLQADLFSLRDEVRGVKEAMLQAMRSPLDAALAGVIVPLAGILIKSLKKKGLAD